MDEEEVLQSDKDDDEEEMKVDSKQVVSKSAEIKPILKKSYTKELDIVKTEKLRKFA